MANKIFIYIKNISKTKFTYIAYIINRQIQVVALIGFKCREIKCHNHLIALVSIVGDRILTIIIHFNRYLLSFSEQIDC